MSRYNKLCGELQHLAHRISQLDPQDTFRKSHEEDLLAKLYAIGVLNSLNSFSDILNKLTVSAICRRRLPVIMTRIKMCENVNVATQYIEQGHVRVGPEVVTDPAFLVTRYVEGIVRLTVGIWKILLPGLIRPRLKSTLWHIGMKWMIMM